MPPLFPAGGIEKTIGSLRHSDRILVSHRHGDPGLINEPVFTELAQKYGKTNVQVILRWHIQAGNIIFPKSTNPQHIRDNSDIFDFALTDDEMARIKAIDNGKRFYTATLEEQERNFSGWAPAD